MLLGFVGFSLGIPSLQAATEDFQFLKDRPVKVLISFSDLSIPPSMKFIKLTPEGKPALWDETESDQKVGLDTVVVGTENTIDFYPSDLPSSQDLLSTEQREKLIALVASQIKAIRKAAQKAVLEQKKASS